jgi:hypothetical protein
MDMLLDKFKSALVCVLVGVMTATTASGLSVALIAQRNATTQRVVFGYALAHPLTSWPLELTLWISLSVTVGVVVALLLWLAISNIRWTRRPRNLKSAEAAADLMAKSATKGARLFGGKFDGNIFYLSIEDRGLVIGPLQSSITGHEIWIKYGHR